MLERLAGNDALKAELGTALRGGRLPHAVLLVGEPGCGAGFAARCLAADYLYPAGGPHAVHRRLLGDPHSDSGGTVRHLPSGTQGRNQTGTQREITNRFRNTGPAVASTTRQFRRPAGRDRIAKKNYGSYSAATDDGRLISAVSPPTKRSRSCGAIRICNPRTPALI